MTDDSLLISKIFKSWIQNTRQIWIRARIKWFDKGLMINIRSIDVDFNRFVYHYFLWTNILVVGIFLTFWLLQLEISINFIAYKSYWNAFGTYVIWSHSTTAWCVNVLCKILLRACKPNSTWAVSLTTIKLDLVSEFFQAVFAISFLCY